MVDRLLHEIARLMLGSLGADAVRIHDHGVDVKHAAGNFRIEVTRL